jgi:hypothetical protein
LRKHFGKSLGLSICAVQCNNNKAIMEVIKLSDSQKAGATVISGQLEQGTYKFSSCKAAEIVVSATPSDKKEQPKKYILLELEGNAEKDGVTLGRLKCSIPLVPGWAESVDPNSTVVIEVAPVLDQNNQPKLTNSGYVKLRTRVISVED